MTTSLSKLVLAVQTVGTMHIDAQTVTGVVVVSWNWPYHISGTAFKHRVVLAYWL